MGSRQFEPRLQNGGGRGRGGGGGGGGCHNKLKSVDFCKIFVKWGN